MPQPLKERKDRFARMFPPRVEKAIKQFQLISNCSNPSDYAYKDTTVAKVWVHLLLAMKAAAKEFGLDVEFTINNKRLDELYVPGTIEKLVKGK